MRTGTESASLQTRDDQLTENVEVITEVVFFSGGGYETSTEGFCSSCGGKLPCSMKGFGKACIYCCRSIRGVVSRKLTG